MFCAKGCVVATQGHPRSILPPMESTYSACCYSLIATLVLFCTISEIRWLIGRKTPIFPTPLSFNALAGMNPFECVDGRYIAKTPKIALTHQLCRTWLLMLVDPSHKVRLYTLLMSKTRAHWRSFFATLSLYTGCSRKTAQSFAYDKFGTVRRKIKIFVPIYTEFNDATHPVERHAANQGHGHREFPQIPRNMAFIKCPRKFWGFFLKFKFRLLTY